MDQTKLPIENVKKKILIVEDDFYIKDLYEIEAKRAGFDVVTASDGEEALVKVTAERPDLMILDLMLPKRDGLSVLKLVKADQVFVKLPVLIITNLEDPVKEQEAKEAGASEYMLKIKNTPEQVIDVVKKYIS